MAEPFLAEMRWVGFNFAPRGWAFCDGQILPINQNQSLYSLLGTTYGGDGRTSFALPDMRGRTPLHSGTGRALGQKGGVETVTLNNAEIPAHRHNVVVNNAAHNNSTPQNHYLADFEPPAAGVFEYTSDTSSLAMMNTGTLLNTGGNQAHDNMQPFVVLNCIIALRGLFPSRN